MKRVSSAVMAKRFSAYCDTALNAPVVITKNGRDRLVLLSVDEYNYLIDLIEEHRGRAEDSDVRLRSLARVDQSAT
ncbi:MAG TPA: type II toxin-antitoxin system Phd/YefM family antitoxin [Methylocystis sp.]|nr:type II toxin-antitoxin system Phd/YefM family antitoxin [Methylocystis sp.]